MPDIAASARHTSRQTAPRSDAPLRFGVEVPCSWVWWLTLATLGAFARPVSVGEAGGRYAPRPHRISAPVKSRASRRAAAALAFLFAATGSAAAIGPVITISPNTLPDATVGVTYSQ